MVRTISNPQSNLTAEGFSSKTALMSMQEALNDSLRLKMAEDENIYLMGEDIGVMGGMFRVTRGLQKDFGEQRVLDSPLSETALVGAAIGMALLGLRPVVEIPFIDFIYPAADQIINELARMRYRSAGQFCAPVVIRGPYGGGIGGGLYHSQSPEAFFTQVPGLKVVIPASPGDAKGLLTAALEDEDPVLFLEPKRLYQLFKEDVPVESYRVPLGRAAISREGRDLTIIAYGAMVTVALQTAELASDEGLDCEVIDLRTLNPWDEKLVFESVAKTRRAAVLHEAPITCGFGAEVSARVGEELFDSLRGPVLRIAGCDTHYPFALENIYYPTPQRVLHRIREAL